MTTLTPVEQVNPTEVPLAERPPLDVQDVQDVKEEQPAEPVRGSTLRSIFQDETFYIGICPPESVKPDGGFSLSTALIYSHVDSAIQELESVLAHARQVRDYFVSKQAYEKAKADVVAKLQSV